MLVWNLGCSPAEIRESLGQNKNRIKYISNYLVFFSLQEVGPNTSGDVRGLCQQDTGA